MGRGSSKAGGGGKFGSIEAFEKTIKGDDDPRITEFTNTYNEESDYTTGLEKNLKRAISEDGYSSVADTIASEEKATKKQLNGLPKQKTPSQLGEEAALKERLDVISELKKKKKTKGKGLGDINIVVEK